METSYSAANVSSHDLSPQRDRYFTNNKCSFVFKTEAHVHIQGGTKCHCSLTQMKQDQLKLEGNN